MGKKFTKSAEKVIMYSQECAFNNGNELISSEHLLFGLLKYGYSSKVLKRVNLNETILSSVIHDKSISNNVNKKVPISYSENTRKIIELSCKEARRLGHESVGTTHLLLGILKNENSKAYKTLNIYGINKIVELAEKKVGLTSRKIILRRYCGLFILLFISLLSTTCFIVNSKAKQYLGFIVLVTVILDVLGTVLILTKQRG